MLGGLWGAVVGDALGVPVEFRSREELRQDPVQDMRGYGTYNQPAGTWSDDSSLLLCTAESLLDGFDTRHLASLFVRWLHQAHWTPWEEVFDVGGTTHRAINNLSKGAEPEEAGLTDENSNGNGSLMRILPIALHYFSHQLSLLQLNYPSTREEVIPPRLQGPEGPPQVGAAGIPCATLTLGTYCWANATSRR